MAETLLATKQVLQTGDVGAIKTFHEDNQSFFYGISREPGYEALRANLPVFLDICEVLSKRTEDIENSKDLYDAIGNITSSLDYGFRALLDDADEIEDEEDLWRCGFDLVTLALRSASPILISHFSWTLVDDRLPYQKLPSNEHLELFKLLEKQLSLAVVKIRKRALGNELGQGWNDFLYHVFIQICGVYSNFHNPKVTNKPFLEALVSITVYCVDRILELKSTSVDQTTPYHYIYLHVAGTMGYENVDLCAQLVRSFHQIKTAGFGTDNDLVYWANYCIGLVVDKLGPIKDVPLEEQIDLFLKECETDQNTRIPDLMIKSYTAEPDVIHRHLEAIFSKTMAMPLHNAVQICELAKVVAVSNPQVMDEKLLAHMYTFLSHDNLCYYTIEAITHVCKVHPEWVDVSPIMTFGATTAHYIYIVCELFSLVGTGVKSDHKKAESIIEWLLQQCQNPLHSAHRRTILGAVKAVGHEHLDQLMLFRPVIETLNEDAALRDDTRGMLDLLQGRSLGDAYVKLDDQEERVDGVEEEVEVVKEKVGEVDKTVKKQGEELAAAVADLKITKQDVKDLRQSVDKVLVDIERVDKRMANATPKWCQSVANLLNPKSNSDWIALALRLNYTVEDVAAWGTLEDPCMGLLVEWYATHKNFEATRAIYIVLKDLARDDGAEIVAKALKDAGEMVPVDEPLDIKHPPAIFLSYQWGVQEKAKLIKDYLTSAGFSCWMDIGQMGGGDKLYEKIDHGIRGAKAIISLVTEKYATSANCNKEVNLCVNLQKPMFQLLMKNMQWPPAGAMGPIFAEYLFVRFFLRGKEQNKSGNSWPEAKMEELLMQLRHVVEPDPKLVSKQMDDWWLEKTGNAVISEPMPLAAPASQVFISYQWGKQTQVKELYERLTSLGFSCWLDIMQMGGGDSLYDKIDRGIRSCKLVLCCVTQKYSLSVNCRREVSLATATEKKIIPLLLESTRYPPAGPMSVPLAELQFLDFSKQAKLVEGPPYDALLKQLNNYFKAESEETPPEKSSPPAASAKTSTSKKPDQPAEPAKSSSCLIL